MSMSGNIHVYKEGILLRVACSFSLMQPFVLTSCIIHQQKNEKLKYIAFFPSETPILNFLSRHFRGYKRDYFFQNPYGSKI